MRKRLLCIAPDDANPAAFLTGPMREWETCRVANLGDAARALLRSADLDSFLRRHRDTQ